MSACSHCGAEVGDQTKHDEWHATLVDQAIRLEQVEDKADGTANILFQRGID